MVQTLIFKWLHFDCKRRNTGNISAESRIKAIPCTVRSSSSSSTRSNIPLVLASGEEGDGDTHAGNLKEITTMHSDSQYDGDRAAVGISALRQLKSLRRDMGAGVAGALLEDANIPTDCRTNGLDLSDELSKIYFSKQ